MTPIFPSLPASLGVYTLTRLLGSHETCDRYIARQSHVDRSVVVEVLRPGCPQETLDRFLRSARARVASRVPQASQVLESMVSGSIWYITLECPEGTPLSNFVNKGKRLTTGQACEVLRQTSLLYDHCAREGLAAAPMTPDCIFIRKSGEVSFLSPVMAGTPTPELHAMQLDALAETMQQVRPEGEAGQTRVATLLEWLGQEFDGQRMEWQAVAATAEYIRDQVAPLVSVEKVAVPVVESAATRKRRMLRQRRAIIRTGAFAVVGVACAVLISLLGLLIVPFIKVEPLPAVQDKYVLLRVKGRNMAVMSAPVTVAEYNKFLDDYENMPQNKRNQVNHGLPASETGHYPLDWDQQLKSAYGNQKWHGRDLVPHSPVRGVSFWDAKAYANYRKGELPNLHLLYTVRKATEYTLTSEWSSTVRVADPIYSQAVMVLPAKGAQTPQLEPDHNHRDPNRSFRIILPSIPRKEP